MNICVYVYIHKYMHIHTWTDIYSDTSDPINDTLPHNHPLKNIFEYILELGKKSLYIQKYMHIHTHIYIHIDTSDPINNALHLIIMFQ
jgi:hypothetical protein